MITDGGDSSSSGLMSSIPTALSRWAEEARVLDGDSMHDCITGSILNQSSFYCIITECEYIGRIPYYVTMDDILTDLYLNISHIDPLGLLYITRFTSLPVTCFHDLAYLFIFLLTDYHVYSLCTHAPPIIFPPVGFFYRLKCMGNQHSSSLKG